LKNSGDTQARFLEKSLVFFIFIGRKSEMNTNSKRSFAADLCRQTQMVRVNSIFGDKIYRKGSD